jgi:endo-1,4-beta-xylanase
MGLAAAIGVMPVAAKPFASPPEDSLDRLAKAAGLIGFGSCIGSTKSTSVSGSFDDAGVRAIHQSECGLLVSSNEMKWPVLRPDAASFAFERADRIVAWGEQAGMKIRGHTLLWHRADRMPKWLVNYDFGTRPGHEAERLLREHITTVCGHYGSRLFTWDVVNETIDPATGKLRETVFTRHLGPAVIEIAYHAARAAAPSAVLVYNDYMTWTEASARHCDGVLELLASLKRAHLPVGQLGVQSHIGDGRCGEVDGDMRFDDAAQRRYRAFLDAVVAMDYRLAITELDVSEDGTPADIAARDAMLADLTRRYLEFMLSYRQLDYVLAWGMVDHHSWLQTRGPRADGMLKRPSLYDPNYAPKPMRTAIAQAFRTAKRG